MSTVSAVVQQMRSPLETISPLELEQQYRSGHLTAGKDSSRAVRDAMTGRNSLEVAAGHDSVSISEEGRARHQAMTQEKDSGRKNPLTLNQPKETEADDTAAQAHQALLKQIKQVKEQLADAQQRLAAATATGKAPSGAAAQPAPGANSQTQATQTAQGMHAQTQTTQPAPDTSAQGQAVQAQAVQGMGAGGEAEAIQTEIKMLQQQLQTLYQQLQQSIQGGGGMGGGMPGAGSSTAAADSGNTGSAQPTAR